MKFDDDKIDELLELGENILVSAINGNIIVATAVKDRERIAYLLESAASQIRLELSNGTLKPTTGMDDSGPDSDDEIQ